MLKSLFAALGWQGMRWLRTASPRPEEYVSLKHGRVRLEYRAAPRIVRQSGIRSGVVPGDILVRGVRLATPRGGA